MDERPNLGPAVPPLRDFASVLTRIADRLASRHRHAFSKTTVTRYVDECARLLSSGARTRRHLAASVERFADQRLRALARASGLVPKPVPEVLFVCTENAGRSQLAGALLRRHADGAVAVATAGSAPGEDLAPVVRRLLEEQGLDAGEEFPKPVTREVINAADVVVTLGCGDACPVIPGRRYLDWDLPDLSGLDIESARAVRDALQARIERLVAELRAAAPAA
uniref:Putative arsenate reductase (ArsC) n=3 Tax=unclassified Streptomyces TaxID=2593676 RepID=V9Z460_9ACTN|nr:MULTISPECIES: low molecular weight phosphatase family protein [unclassified Streptomyces]AHE39034.1 Putative arsenate reductase (ArsC) [Streptomyces sp. FR1]AHE39553.1 Putative arsenate reductase (ArsC) [Streptomyces sp. F2]AHE40275.1 Putative arsenate reductase (arsC) [Streptomyces sp. F12]